MFSTCHCRPGPCRIQTSNSRVLALFHICLAPANADRGNAGLCTSGFRAPSTPACFWTVEYFVDLPSVQVTPAQGPVTRSCFLTSQPASKSILQRQHDKSRLLSKSSTKAHSTCYLCTNLPPQAMCKLRN